MAESVTREFSGDFNALACLAMGLSEERTREAIEGGKVNQLVIDTFRIALSSFEQVAKALLPLAPPVTMRIDGERFHVFANGENAIVKSPFVE
uniref:Uncharacterized protein n=1 Tax=Candidatus Kentrum sp. FM TaxID=2126340 RepID=A0A450S696_9GAMM|nr:MAG: hypothetical protein BECKFM1743A_GA0114220_100474 [Candidatus Kentron sp. FM]VFJ47882.1 MAG: hypothetical protein BECKFM1743C_GA0114222_1005117 [Candidatus Kentron sp. FM]VFK07834.1 MAG: hypothetical protein BECKFM1743B_GA0114221_100524 [Candidatus Kentron sp. FM]